MKELLERKIINFCIEFCSQIVLWSIFILFLKSKDMDTMSVYSVVLILLVVGMGRFLFFIMKIKKVMPQTTKNEEFICLTKNSVTINLFREKSLQERSNGAYVFINEKKVALMDNGEERRFVLNERPVILTIILEESLVIRTVELDLSKKKEINVFFKCYFMKIDVEVV